MPVAKILIATPVRGASPETADVKLGWATSMTRLARDPNVELTVAGFGCDLVRSRSRMVRQALEADRFTHVLWWDDDVLPRDIQVIRRMLESGHDIVGAPYPRKLVHWDRATAVAADGMPAEWGAYDYPVSVSPLPLGVQREFHGGCTAVDHIGMGFMLTATSALQRMWDHYAPTLSFGDVFEGRKAWTVALFQLLLPPQEASENGYAVGPLLSEDYSFCERARAIGIGVQMYVGPGSPVDHVGTHVFRGHREGLVQAR